MSHKTKHLIIYRSLQILHLMVAVCAMSWMLTLYFILSQNHV